MIPSLLPSDGPLARPRFALAACLLGLAAAVAYAPFVPLPAISDDYMQIGLGWEFLSADGFTSLAEHPLYRTRATSILFTRILDLLFGTAIAWHRVAGLLLHWLNGMLILSLGAWPRIGYRRSLVAAMAFVLFEGHQEAVIWVAAVHELLVFAFTLACLFAWGQWLRLRRPVWVALTAVSFVLALYSKESAAILPALLFALWGLEGTRRRYDLIFVTLSAMAVLVYAYFVFMAASQHQHLNDGTFSLHAPFVLNLLRTLRRLFWPWGLIAAAVLLWQRRPLPLAAALAWSAIALLPYSFLTYMPFAPSRHTYLASLGLAFAVAFAWDALASVPRLRWRRAAAALGLLFVVFNPLYLWLKKYPQYEFRSRPTEDFLAFARQQGKPVYVGPSPYSVWVYRYTAFVALGWSHSDVISIAEAHPPKDSPVFSHPLEP